MSRRKTTGNKQGKNENGDFESLPNQKMTRSVLKAHTAQTRNNEVEQSIQSHPSTYSTSEIMSNSENELHHFDSKAQSTDHISEDSNRQSMTESMKNSHLTPDEESKCRQAAEEYISNCKFYNVPIDPSVVIALQTGWKVLQPTSRFTEGSMLPLKNILEENNTIRKLNLSNVGMQDSRFRQAGNGNANARILNFILQRNKTIEELDLSNNGLDDDGIREICDGLKENQSIKKLNLSRNHFGVEGTNYLNNALSINQSIHDLDLSRNALGYHSINSLLCICGPRKVQVVTQGNYVFEEILNSVSHGVAFIGSVVGAFILIADATDTYSTDYHFWSSIIYSFALMFLFLSSCLFHSFFMLPSTMRILQILDHVGIYLVIAGTYTPFLLVALHKHTSATVLLIFEWIAALLGIFFATCSDLNNPNTTKVELSLFLGMGLGVVMVGDLLWTELSKQALILLLVGGGLYIVGIAFFILGEYRPIYHVVWHLFVVVAACAHWFAVYFFVLQVSLENTPTRAAVTEFADSVYGAAEAIDNLVNRTLAQMH